MYRGVNLRELPKPINKLISILSIVAGIFLIIVASLTVADVAMRNIIGKSILGTVDISSLLLVCIAFLGLSAAEREGQHVSVNLLEMHLSQRARCIFSVARTVLFITLGIVIVWGLFNDLTSSISREETTNGILRLPTWPTKIILLLSFFCYFLVATWKSINDFLDIRDGTEEKDSYIVEASDFTQSDSNSHTNQKGVS